MNSMEQIREILRSKESHEDEPINSTIVSNTTDEKEELYLSNEQKSNFALAAEELNKIFVRENNTPRCLSANEVPKKPPRKSSSISRKYNEKFATEKNSLMEYEKEYIDKLLRITKDPNFHIYSSKGIGIKVFGLLEELLSVHQNTFLPQLYSCRDHNELIEIFINNKDNLFLHLKNEREICDRYDFIFREELRIDFDFYNLSANLIKRYMITFEVLKQDDATIIGHKFNLAVSILKNLCEQILYVKNELKLIEMEHDISYNDVGMVYCKERMKLGKFLLRKNVDVFFTENYILVTEPKDGNYVILEAAKMSVAKLEVKTKYQLNVNVVDKGKKKQIFLLADDDSSWDRIKNYVLINK